MAKPPFQFGGESGGRPNLPVRLALERVMTPATSPPPAYLIGERRDRAAGYDVVDSTYRAPRATSPAKWTREMRRSMRAPPVWKARFA